MSGLTPEQKELLKNEIKMVRLDAKNQEALEKIPLERLVGELPYKLYAASYYCFCLFLYYANFDC